MNVRVADRRSSVKKPVPSETATNSKASNVAPAVPTSTCHSFSASTAGMNKPQCIHSPDASAKLTSVGLESHLSRFRGHAVPELVEIPIVEERDCLEYFCVPHLKIPGICIAIGFAVFHRGFGIEQGDDHIAISVDAANGWNQRLRHARVERINHSVDKFFLAVISLSRGDEPTIVHSTSVASSSWTTCS